MSASDVKVATIRNIGEVYIIITISIIIVSIMITLILILIILLMMMMMIIIGIVAMLMEPVRMAFSLPSTVSSSPHQLIEQLRCPELSGFRA